MFCNHLLKPIRSIFIRIFKKKRMSIIDIKKNLDEFISKKFSELHIYCTGTVSPWADSKIEDVIQITRQSEPVEFTYLGWNFILKKDIYPFDSIGYLKTYEIVLDELNYPNKKLIHLPDMDISIQMPFLIPENFKFRVDNIINQDFGKNPDGNRMQVPMNRAIIRDFPPHYIAQLYTTLAKVHKDEWGS